jgi:hypothetical protein
MASPSCIVLSTTKPPGIKDEIWTFGRIALLPSQPAEAQSRTSSELSQTLVCILRRRSEPSQLLGRKISPHADG